MKLSEPGKTWHYVLRAERDLPPAERTVWELKPLSVNDYAAAIDIDSQQGPGSGAITRIRLGLVGWRELRDGKGNEIRFAVDKDNMVKIELLDRIAATPDGGMALLELSGAIRSHATWTEEEEKNLSSPPSSSPENSLTLTAKDAAQSEGSSGDAK
jgi:hypothetical protein